MATANTPTTMAGFHKVVYADGVAPLIPEEFPLYKMLSPKFKEGKKIGKHYSLPLEVASENGFTFGGAGGDAFALEDAIAGETVDAQIQGYEHVLRVQLSQAAASRARTSQAAFAKATDFKMKGAARSFAQLAESLLLYGQSTAGLGSISAVANGTVSASNKNLTISAATWAPGIWLGRKGMKLDSYNTSGTKINTNATLVIVRVDLANRVLEVSGNSTDLAALAANQVLVYRGAYSNTFVGFDAMVNATTLWGITTATNELVKAQSLAVGGVLSMQHLLDAAALAANVGASGKMVALIPSDSFSELVGDEAALRRYNSEKKAVNGFETIEFVAGAVTVAVVGSAFVKGGEGFLFPMKDTYLIGSTDITDKSPVTGEAEWKDLEATNGAQLKLYADFAPVCERPAAIVKLTGIS